MNSVIEKEKKLNLALTKLKNLNLKNPDIKKNIENLKVINIIKESKADDTIPCKERNSTFNSFLIRTIRGFKRFHLSLILLFDLKNQMLFLNCL